MPETDESHECDLFLLSSHHAYMADRSLPSFARLGHFNVHGWGIGSYQDGVASVRRSADPALADGETDLSPEFAAAIEAVCSPVILGHLRLASRRATRPENNHPFCLPFLGYDWLMVHNGTAGTQNTSCHRPNAFSPRATATRRVCSSSSPNASPAT